MSKIVRFTETAGLDLETIGDWIALDNPNRAALFVREISKKCMQLATMSERFVRVDGHTDVRKRVHGNYVIFYRASDKAVHILHIFHGSTNIDDSDFHSTEFGES